MRNLAEYPVTSEELIKQLETEIFKNPEKMMVGDQKNYNFSLMRDFLKAYRKQLDDFLIGAQV